MALHAIETEYNGYRFRSRLEARWAVPWWDCTEAMLNTGDAVRCRTLGGC